MCCKCILQRRMRRVFLGADVRFANKFREEFSLDRKRKKKLYRNHDVFLSARIVKRTRASELVCRAQSESNQKILWLSRLPLRVTYLGPAAVQAFHVGTRLPKIGCVVEDLFVATARLVLHIIQRADLAFGLDFYFLRRDLEIKRTTCIDQSGRW